MANFKITCPKNIRHTKFSVTAHVAQEWEVDDKAEFSKVITDCTDVTHKPDQDDHYICLTCGSEALTLKN